MKIPASYHILFIILAVVFQAMSGILLKYASISAGSSLYSLFFNSFYLLTIGCLVLQALVWQMALKHFDLSFAYPFVSMANFIILIASYLCFNEGITLANIAGLALVTMGVYFMSRDLVAP